MTRNQRKGKACEEAKKIEYQQKGNTIIETGKGHDFIAIGPKNKITHVEVKNGCHGLTPFQKKTKAKVEKNGGEYKIERCGCPTKMDDD